MFYETNQEGMTNFGAYKCYTLSKSGCTRTIKNYFEIYKEYKPLDKGGDTEVNFTKGIVKPQGIGTTSLELEDDKGKIQNIILYIFYYFSGVLKILIIHQKWSRDRRDAELGREGTYLKVMGKRSVLMRNNCKSKRNTLQAPGCALPETSIN